VGTSIDDVVSLFKMGGESVVGAFGKGTAENKKFEK